MLKRHTICGIVFVIVLAFSNYAWSDVVGRWNVAADVTTTVSLKKVKPVKESGPMEDTFVFESDFDFLMTDMEGKWSYTDKKQTKFVILLNNTDVENYFEETLPVEATLDSYKFKGKLNKDGTISGKFKMKLSINVTDGPYAGKTGKVDAKASFTGTRGTPSALSDGANVQSLPSSIYGFVLEKIAEAIFPEE